MLKLSFGLDFADLHQREGLARLDAQFLHFIAASDPALREALLAARAAPEALAPKAESELLIALAPQLCVGPREGFALTDPGTDLPRRARPGRTTASGATQQGKDSCSQGRCEANY
jgi:hypothetical protein